jgi:hypothetical protein
MECSYDVLVSLGRLDYTPAELGAMPDADLRSLDRAIGNHLSSLAGIDVERCGLLLGSRRAVRAELERRRHKEDVMVHSMFMVAVSLR